MKGTLIGEGQQIQRTHDLGILVEQLKACKDIPDYIYDICDNLTPYGVKIRYPQELYMEEHHVDKAIEEMKKVFEWIEMGL